MNWRDKLNAHQKEHLKETGATTLKQLRELRTAQRVIADGCKTRELCWDCKDLARTLGIEP